MSFDDEYVDRSGEFTKSEVELIEQFRKVKTPNKGKPWRRFWARTLDTGLHSFPVVFCSELIKPGYYMHILKKYEVFAVSLIYLPFILIFEAIVLSIFGITLGKYLLGIHLAGRNGQRLTFGSATVRTFSLWVKGLAFGFPLVSALTAAYAAGRIRKHGTATWDDDAKVQVDYKQLSGVKTVAAILLIIGILILNSLYKHKL